jgi:hypothetical protein
MGWNWVVMHEIADVATLAHTGVGRVVLRFRESDLAPQLMKVRVAVQRS